MSELSGHLAAARRHLKAIPSCMISDDKMPDVIGVLNELRALAQTIVVDLKVETVAARGEVYELVEDGSYSRSYNIQGLLVKRMAADPEITIADVLREWLDEGVFPKTLRWTQLVKWAHAHDVSLTIARHEIKDGDVDDVGEYWKPKPLKVQPIKIEKGSVL